MMHILDTVLCSQIHVYIVLTIFTKSIPVTLTLSKITGFCAIENDPVLLSCFMRQTDYAILSATVPIPFNLIYSSNFECMFSKHGLFCLFVVHAT